MRYGKHTKCLFQLGMEKGPVVCADWFLYFEIFGKKRRKKIMHDRVQIGKGLIQ